MLENNICEIALLLGIDPKTMPSVAMSSGVKITDASREKVEAEETDLTDEEFEMVKPHLPPEPASDGMISNRTILDALIWVQVRGRALTHLPARYGSAEAVRKRAERWAVAGLWDRLSDAIPNLDILARRRLALLSVCIGQGRRGERIRRQRAAQGRI